MNILNLVCSIVTVITVVFVIFFDAKYQKIPLWLITLNYIALSLLVHQLMIIGLVAILILKHYDKPIDCVYICYLCVCMLTYHNMYCILCIIPMFIQIIFSDHEKLSFMVSIEIASLMIVGMKILGVIT